MSTEHQSVINMWNSYLNESEINEQAACMEYKTWYFCNDENSANELAQLVVEGTKKATASLYELYEYQGEVIPQVGEYSIITNWNGIAQCIIRTTQINIIQFKDVSSEFAAKEGEGDKSLEYWRRVHWSFFSDEMEEINKQPYEDMLVLCEEFEVVYK